MPAPYGSRHLCVSLATVFSSRTDRCLHTRLLVYRFLPAIPPTGGTLPHPLISCSPSWSPVGAGERTAAVTGNDQRSMNAERPTGRWARWTADPTYRPTGRRHDDARALFPAAIGCPHSLTRSAVHLTKSSFRGFVQTKHQPLLQPAFIQSVYGICSVSCFRVIHMIILIHHFLHAWSYFLSNTDECDSHTRSSMCTALSTILPL